MPNSLASLDSLSSPSPSPPPQAQRPNHNSTGTTGAGLDSGSELSELTEEEQESETPKNKGEERDESEERGNLRSLRRGGRKKRGGIVPAPMWDWAKPKSATVVEEEEEEEVPGPPRAMEEEEDEEEVDSGRTTTVNENPDEEEEEEDEPQPSGPSQPSSRSKRARRKVLDDIESGSDDSRDGWYDNTKKKGPRRRSRRRSISAEDSGREYYSDGELSDPDVPVSLLPDTNGILSGNETEFEEEEDMKLPSVDDPDSQATATPIAGVSVTNDVIVATTSMVVDVTAPSPAAVAPLVAAAAASSIMAGSSVLRTPSPASSVSGTPASSRSPSPALSLNAGKVVNGEKHESPRLKREKAKNVQDSAAMPPPAVPETASIQADADQDQDPETLIDDAETQDQDGDIDMELESDLQPAHRAEALDVLATIELKFALLREKVYIEKMEGLAWEEALVSDSTHPELIHLQAELLKRRDKRIELATRKRAYEVANATKRRATDEAAVWSWWKFSRDELQTDMISETNRKRRKLERDRRAYERPQPVRRIPNPPQDVPTPPTLRQIVKSFPFTSSSQKPASVNPLSASLVYPELSPLASADIDNDLEFLYTHRRPVFDAHRSGNMHAVSTNASVAVSAPPFEAYNGNGMPIDGSPFGASGSRIQHPPFSHQHSHPHQHSLHPLPISQQPPPNFLNLGPRPARSQHQLHPAPLNMHNHTSSPFPVEQEMSFMTPGAPLHMHQQPHQYHGPSGSAPLGSSGHNGHGYSSQNHPGARRSVSPSHRSKAINGWPGEGSISGFHHSQKQHRGVGDWMGDGRRADVMHDAPEDEARLRARERDRGGRRDRGRDEMRERIDRDRDREYAEFEREHERERYHLQQQAIQQQHNRHPPAPLHHIHTNPSQTHPSQTHHHPGHHHHHHHHHILHHHPQQGVPQGPGAGQLSPNGQPPSMSLAPLGSKNYLLSPRVGESNRLHPSEQQHAPLSKSSIPPSGPSSLWKVDSEAHLSSSEYREIRSKHGSRPASGPPTNSSVHDDRDRPLATPFVMSSLHVPPSSNGQIASSSVAPPPHSPWTPLDDSHRIPPPSIGAPSGIDGHTTTNTPSSHRYSRPPPPPPQSRQSSLGLSSPRSRPPPPQSPSSAFPGPMRSPTRYAPAPSHPLSSAPPPSSSHGSLSTSPLLKTHRPSSPKISTGNPSVFSPLLSGPGRTSTPLTLGAPIDLGRTSSPLTTFPPQPPLARPPPNVADKHSPHIPPPKMTVAQMVDGP